MRQDPIPRNRFVLALGLALPLCLSAQTEIEPNNNTVQATPVAYNTAMAGNTGACTTTDNTVDYFLLTPSDHGVMRIQTAMSNSGGTDLTVTMNLRNSSGTLLETYNVTAGGNNSVVNETFTHLCSGVGNYFISINNPSGAVCTDYSFTYDVLPPVFGSDQEPNNSSVQAADTLAAGVDRDGRMDFLYGDAVDYHRILAPNDGVLTVTVDAEHAGATAGTMTLRLRNNSSTQLESWTVNVGANGVPANNTFTHRCTGTELVYFLSFEGPSDCGISYRFNYTVQQPFYGDDAEPNNNSVQAIMASAGSDYDGRLNFDYDNTLDWYRLQAPNDGVLTLTVWAEHADGAPGSVDVRLRNNSTTQLELWTVTVGANGVPAQNNFIHRCTGTENIYYLDLSNADVCGVSYRFNYSVAAPVFGDDAEPNENTVQATIANAGTDYVGRLDFDYDNTTDYYRLQAPDDGVITVNIQAEHSGPGAGTITARLLNSAVTQLETWTVNIGPDGTAQSNTFSHNCIGTEQVYYLRLESPSVCGTSYSLNYSVASPFFGDDLEPNNSSVQASLIDLDAGSVPGRVNFEYDDNTDWFKVNHPGGILTVDIDAENAGPAGTMTVRIRNSASTVQATNSTAAVGGNGMPASSTTATTGSVAAGTYYIEVQSTTVCGVSYSLNCYDDDNDGTCNAFDLCSGGPEPGTPCDDGDATTENDAIDMNCVCIGTSIFDCPNLMADIGDACDDGDAGTYGDVVDANCACIGTPYDCPALMANIGDACDDMDPNTTGDAIDANCVCTGSSVFDCPNLMLNIGDACDDGDAATHDDVVDANCVCAGTPYDCPNLMADIGDACDDMDPNTTGDAIDANCVCTGSSVFDCPNLMLNIGDACDDSDAGTHDDVVDANCVCAGTPYDCPNLMADIGDACDDGDPNTSNDVVGSNCVCAGTPVGSCPGFLVELLIQLDANGGDGITWEFRDAVDNVLDSGGPYVGQANVLISENVCLEDQQGDHFTLRLFDSFGDGLTGGYWEIRNDQGDVILHDNGDFGDQSPSAAPFSLSYIEGHGFDLPLGPAGIMSSSCQVFNYSGFGKVYADLIGGAALYQFEFCDPNAGWRRRIAVPRNWVKISEMQTYPLVPGTTYFVHVRVDQGASGFSDDNFGPGCEMAVDPSAANPCTQLIDDPDLPTFSCGATKSFGGGDKIWTRPIAGATQYRFRFENAGEGYVRYLVKPTYVLVLNWTTYPLEDGVTYDVSVESFMGGQWSGFCGNVCALTIQNTNAALTRELSTEEGQRVDLEIWPNPTDGRGFEVLATGGANVITERTMTISDMTGRVVLTRRFAQAGDLRTTVSLPDGLPAGSYLVSITSDQHVAHRTLIVR
ncbi:MAG: T9SS type A sorting domain-containing protein [Flavobacteriales bacterium]|nr:T9SS type A sorting domain-containing protein [Flavobacteriales bacterium]